MADDNKYRSARLGDSYRRVTQPPLQREPMTGSDPLAELARLIGKSDPYAEFGLSQPPEEPQQNYSPAASADRDWRDHNHYDDRSDYDDRSSKAYAEGAEADARQGDAAAPESYADYQHSASAHNLESWRSDDSYREPRSNDSYHEPRLDDDVHSYGDAAGSHEEEPPEEGYLYDEPVDSDAEQIYDDPPRAARRGGLAMALALVGCAVLGTAGAYGYRSYYAQPTSTQPPPVITADTTTPTKIVRAPAGEVQSGKVIQDRLADAAREQIVSKQEEPVALKDLGTQAAPRVVLPAPVAPAPVASQQAPAGSAGTASSEPKKVRTVTIRPDGGDAGAKPVSRGSGGPLSLDPQAKDASAPPAPPAPRATRSAAAPAPPAPRATTESGGNSTSGFLVQLSSQKTEAEAAASFRSLQAKFPNELGRRQPVIQRADLGSKGVFFRTMVGPFASVQDASQFCASYKAAGGHCVVPSN